MHGREASCPSRPTSHLMKLSLPDFFRFMKMGHRGLQCDLVERSNASTNFLTESTSGKNYKPYAITLSENDLQKDTANRWVRGNLIGDIHKERKQKIDWFSCSLCAKYYSFRF